MPPKCTGHETCRKARKYIIKKRMANWVIPFVDVHDVEYEIRIGGASVKTTLTGALSPIEIQADGSTDMFEPIRKQTGYVRIFDDGFDDDGNAFDWTALIPTSATSRPVTLVRLSDNSIMWRGYIKPENYSSEYYGNPQTREFPVVCQLSVLESEDISPTQATVANIAYLIHYLVTLVPANTWNNVILPTTEAIGTLRKCVQWSNFGAQDNAGILRAKYNGADLLEELCRFLGWTAQQDGGDLVFTMDYDCYEFRKISISDLEDIGDDSYTGTPTVVQWDDITLTDSMFVDTHNEEEYLQGIKKAVVKANVNKVESALEVPFDAIREKVDTVTPQKIELGTDQWRFVQWSDSIMRDSDPQHTHWEDWPAIWEANGIKVTIPLNAGRNRASIIVDEYYNGALADKHNYNFTCRLELYGDISLPTDYMVRIETTEYYCLYDGVLAISGAINTNSTGTIIMRLSVGGNYWTGSGWSLTATTFSVGFKEGKITDTRALDGPYENYEGYGMTLNGNIGGRIVCDILNVVDDLQSYIILQSFAIQLVTRRTATKRDNDDENTYEVETGYPSYEDRNVNTIFATDDNNFQGRGLILNPNGGFCRAIDYDGGSLRPEYHLAHCMAEYYDETKQVLHLTLDSGAVAGISQVSRIVDGTKVYYIGAISRNFAEAKAKVLLLEA